MSLEFQDAQQVCLNGHQITSTYHKYPEDRESRCSKCGETTIHKCPKCNHEIAGTAFYENVYAGLDVEVPDYCKECGAPFPWTLKKTDRAAHKDDLDRLENALSTLADLALRFRQIVHPLLDRRKDREPLKVQDEYDVQDLFHVVLRAFFCDVRPEEWTPSYAGASKRMDFLLKKQQTVVETKMTRAGLNQLKLSEELTIDIAYYQQHPDCMSLFCFVYDPGHHIANVAVLENDMSRKHNDLMVRVHVSQ